MLLIDGFNLNSDNWKICIILICTVKLIAPDKWSTSYCPVQGCQHRCQHLVQLDMMGTTDSLWCENSIYWRFMSVYCRAISSGSHAMNIDVVIVPPHPPSCSTSFLRDLNNDGLCDQVCVDLNYTTLYVQYRTATTFRGHVVVSTSFCNGVSAGYILLVMDIDGDGNDDVICAFDDVLNDNKVRVSYIKGRSTDLVEGMPMDVTDAIVSSQIFADYGNRTLKDKTLFKRSDTCTKYQSQCDHIDLNYHVSHLRYWIEYPWCGWPGGQLHSGDLDGDGYCDLVCHTLPNYQVYVLLYSADLRRLGIPSYISDEAGLLQSAGYCSESFKLIDINRDGRADMVCGLNDLNATPYTIVVSLGVSNDEQVKLVPSNEYFTVMASDFQNLDGYDPVVPCAVSLNRNSVGTPVSLNPCVDVTRNAAYLQANAHSVLGSALGSFCVDTQSSFVSADVDGNGYCDMICHDNAMSNTTSIYVQYLTDDGITYETRHNLPTGTAGLGSNFTCAGKGTLYSIDFNKDNRWDLFCINHILNHCDTKSTYWLAENDQTGLSADTMGVVIQIAANVIGSQCAECPIMNQPNIHVTYNYYVKDRSIGVTKTSVCSHPHQIMRGIGKANCLENGQWSSNRLACQDLKKRPPKKTWQMYENQFNPMSPLIKTHSSGAGHCISICDKLETCWSVSFNKQTKLCYLFPDYDNNIGTSENVDFDTYRLIL